MEPELAGEFDRVFSEQPPEALAYAFANWREVSQFMPTIADIATLLRQWRRQKFDAAEADRARRERAESERARRDGSLAGFDAIVRELKTIAKKMPEAPTAQRLRRAREREVSFIVPPVQLTPEQIAARREFERQEIRKAGESV